MESRFCGDCAHQRAQLPLRVGFKAAEGIARVFFCTVVGRKIVVLHQFVKKSEKTPNREIKIARSRMKELTDD